MLVSFQKNLWKLKGLAEHELSGFYGNRKVNLRSLQIFLKGNNWAKGHELKGFGAAV